MVHRGNYANVDYVFIACIESRFKDSWRVVAGTETTYQATTDDAELIVVELNGLRRRFLFSKDAYVTVLQSNVITFDDQAVDESVLVDEDEQAGRGKNPTVL